MNILVTGAQGMAGSALVRALENLRAGRDRTRPALAVGEIFTLGRGADDAAWDDACARADFVFHFAGVNRAARCGFDGVNAVPRADGRFCYVPGAYRAALGELAALLAQLRAQPETLEMPRMPDGSLAKRLFSLYLTYLPKEKMRYALRAHADARGSFTELLRSADCGQVSVNVARPGVTKGQHWHCAKWEQFIVVHGHGLIRERNLATGETVELEVRGEQPESVYMIPGWTHSITNLSDTEDLVTVMTCNERFDPARPDTFAEEV